MCSVYTFNVWWCTLFRLSTFSPQRSRVGLWCITNFLFSKEIHFYLSTHQLCVSVSLEKHFPSLSLFFMFDILHTDLCSLSVCFPHTGVFRLWLTSRSRRLWRSTWWRRSNANTKARDATVVFLPSVSLSPPHLWHLFSVSLRLSLHASSVLHLFICGKDKKRKCLAFYLFFFFFRQVFCFHASHMPWSHSLTLSLFTPLFSSTLWI